MKHDINQTAVVPYIIAEKVLWNTIETDPQLTKLDIEHAFKVVQQLTKVLETKAEQRYKHNSNFRMLINDSNKDCREVLKMFMQHWTLKIIKSLKLELNLN